MSTTFPICKILIYDTSDALVRTLTTEDLVDCSTKEVVTSGIGSFNFTIPIVKGLTIVDNDIGNNYTAKIYFGYGSSYVHKFTGKILPFTSAITNNAMRSFEGKDLGEILERRFKYNKRWQAAEADDIAHEVATDLSLTHSLDTDTTAETITVRTESYLTLMQKISDYWISAGNKLIKDFYVDKDNTLQWHDRPLRTGINVETFTYGVDFQNYSLKYDILPVKNKVIVYGAAKAPLPLTKDAYTDSLTDWTAVSGTLSTNNTTPKAGTYWIQCDVNAGTKTGAFYRTIPRVYLRDINTLNFWDRQQNESADVAQVQLLAPDTSNYFSSTTGTLPSTAGDHWNQLALGESAEYNVDENPTGIWNKTGSPNWMDIQGVYFLYHGAGGGVGDLDVSIDKLYFYPNRWYSEATDATSQTNYGLREAEYTDDNLLSEAECTTRAETLLYQLKDRIMRLDFAVQGNTNVLVGDRLTLTLPPDEVTAMDFDVVSVENSWGMSSGFKTIVHAVGTASSRQLPSMTPLESIQKQLIQNREVTAELYSRIVR